MFTKKSILLITIIISVISFILIYNEITDAHCDTLDGPVVKACKKSLESGNINYALVWVQETDEQEIKESFEKTIMVRQLGDKAKELADLNFFETVVRIHRKGEGAPYDGLKAAGSNINHSIMEGDKAIETGSLKDVEKLLIDALQEKLKLKYNEVIEKKNFEPNDLNAGREYVKAYVEYIHFVESIYNSSAGNKENQHIEHEKHQ